MRVIKKVGLFTSFAGLAFALSGCYFNESRFVFEIRSDALSPEKAGLSPYITKLQSEVEKLQATKNAQYDLTPFKIEGKVVNDQTTILDDLASSKSSFGYVNARNAGLYTNQSSLVPAIATLTQAFKYDYEPAATYSPDNGKKLEGIAAQINTLFNQTPYKNWQNTLTGPQKWDGSIYGFLYDPDKLVNFYRGAIYIWGKDSELTAIKKAWLDKNWNDFLSHGIMAGKPDSAGKFLLQQRLLNEHFNKNNKPINLLDEQKNNPSKILLGQKGRDLGVPHPTFHIVFDDMSYAWTKNVKGEGQNAIHRFNLPTGDKMEIFMLTDPLPYDIGFFNKNVNPKRQKLISDAIMGLYTSKQDQYGPSVGYNGYQYLTTSDWSNNWLPQIKSALQFS